MNSGQDIVFEEPIGLETKIKNQECEYPFPYTSLLMITNTYQGDSFAELSDFSSSSDSVTDETMTAQKSALGFQHNGYNLRNRNNLHRPQRYLQATVDEKDKTEHLIRRRTSPMTKRSYPLKLLTKQPDFSLAVETIVANSNVSRNWWNICSKPSLVHRRQKSPLERMTLLDTGTMTLTTIRFIGKNGVNPSRTR